MNFHQTLLDWVPELNAWLNCYNKPIHIKHVSNTGVFCCFTSPVLKHGVHLDVYWDDKLLEIYASSFREARLFQHRLFCESWANPQCQELFCKAFAELKATYLG